VSEGAFRRCTISLDSDTLRMCRELARSEMQSLSECLLSFITDRISARRQAAHARERGGYRQVAGVIVSWKRSRVRLRQPQRARFILAPITQ